MEDTMREMLHNTKDKVLSDDTNSLFDNHICTSLQNISLPSDKNTVTSKDSFIPRKEIALPELKPREGLMTNPIKNST